MIVLSASAVRCAEADAPTISRACSGGIEAPSAAAKASTSRRPQSKSVSGASARRTASTDPRLGRQHTPRHRRQRRQARRRDEHEPPHGPRAPRRQGQRDCGTERVPDEVERPPHAVRRQPAGDPLGDFVELEPGAGRRRFAEAGQIERYDPPSAGKLWEYPCPDLARRREAVHQHERLAATCVVDGEQRHGRPIVVPAAEITTSLIFESTINLTQREGKVVKLGRLLLRATVGGFFIGHGTQKLFGWFGGHGLDATGQMFESLGLRPGRRNAIAAGAAEAAGGALLAAGLATPVGAAVITATMLTAIHQVHLKNGPWTTNGGYEYNAVLIAAALTLAEIGPGKPSLDDALGLKLSGPAWAAAAALARRRRRGRCAHRSLGPSCARAGARARCHRYERAAVPGAGDRPTPAA